MAAVTMPQINRSVARGWNVIRNALSCTPPHGTEATSLIHTAAAWARVALAPVTPPATDAADRFGFACVRGPRSILIPPELRSSEVRATGSAALRPAVARER